MKSKNKGNFNASDSGKKHREFGQRWEWGAILVAGSLHLMDKDDASNVKSLDQEHRESDSGRTSFHDSWSSGVFLCFEVFTNNWLPFFSLDPVLKGAKHYSKSFSMNPHFLQHRRS